MSVHQDTLSTPYPDPAFDVNRAFEHAGELSAALAASREIPSFFVSGVLAVNAMYTDAKDAGLANSSATERVSDAIRTLEAAVLEAPEDQSRKQISLMLENLRDALYDLMEQSHVADDRSFTDIIHWLAETTDEVPRVELARVLSVDEKTLTRWLNEGRSPGVANNFRVRAIAKLVNELGHTMTTPGLMLWLSRPKASLGGATPVEHIEGEDELSAVRELARRRRFQTAG
jgi:hypothetical protein